jgi:uncharacterized protein YycO
MNPTNYKTGDILHCTGKRLLSKLIRKFTKSQFSHTALFIEIWGQPYIIDAQKDGVNVRPWNEWVKEYNYKIVAHRSQDTIDSHALSKRALTKVGHTAYDIESLLFRQPLKLLTGKWDIKKDEDNKMYCSEYVAWVYGVEKSYRMSPEDVYQWCLINNFKEVEV